MQSTTDIIGIAMIVVITAPFMIIVAVLLAVSARAKRAQAAALLWPVTDGMILTSDIRLGQGQSGRGRSAAAWHVEVTYRYALSGIDHIGSRIAPVGEPGFLSREAARSRAAQFRAGSPVSVHYNPQAPAEAVLELTAPRIAALGRTARTMTIALVLTVFAMLAIWWLARAMPLRLLS